MPGLFEQFPHTNLHELNLDWIIDMINQFKEELEDSAVLSVNGQTGHVTLYESENVILPALPEGVDQWRLVRMMDGQYAGILFYNGNVYVQRGNSTMRLLTQEDIPSSSGVVSWNGMTGVVNVTGQDIPVDDTADPDSIAQAITNEHTERVNADNALRNNINTLNSKLGTASRNRLNGESEIKTYLLSVANDLGMGDTKLVSIANSNSDFDLMTPYTTYEGYLCVTYKDSAEMHFVWSGYNPEGKDITFGYADGTWTVNSVSNKITEETLTYTDSDSRTVNINFRVWQHMLSIIMNNDNAVTLPTSWTSIGTLSNIKPPSDRYVPFMCAGGGSGVIRIYPDGGTRILGNQNTAIYLQTSASVLIK